MNFEAFTGADCSIFDLVIRMHWTTLLSEFIEIDNQVN